MEKIKVHLLSHTKNPQTVAVAGALACFEERSSAEIYRELMKMPKEERLKKNNKVHPLKTVPFPVTIA